MQNQLVMILNQLILEKQMHHPTIYWAQRKDVVYMRLSVSSATDVKFKIAEETIHFACKSGGEDYACKLTLFAPINPDESKYKITGPCIESILQKKEASDEFWTNLTKTKLPYVRIDWDRWVDEGEDENAAGALPNPGDMDFASMMQNMGGMPGMPGMDGMNFDPSNFKMPEGADFGDDENDDGDDGDDGDKEGEEGETGEEKQEAGEEKADE